MIYSDDMLHQILTHFLSRPENEIVEFKEARSNYSFDDIGMYFSALSNEAGVRGGSEAWLIFGVTNNGSVCGTEYRHHSRSLQSLKKEICQHTNQALTFMEAYELQYEGKRVVLFQIPTALPGIPTTWKDRAYARQGDVLCPLPLNKLDMIRARIGSDWSSVIVDSATLDDLDPGAMALARLNFAKKQGERYKQQDVLEKLTDIELLNKAGLTIKGKITRSALLLLGRSESFHFFDGFVPRITWSLYNANNSIKTYEHFDIPFLSAVDKVFGKIRNVTYRYIAGQMTLFPDEVEEYEPLLIRELLHNCIAHQDYSLRGKINVEEFEDRLLFMNEGGFIPETIEHAITPGYKPPYYRNSFLCNAMVNLNMIDTNAMGIPTMFQIQRDRFFPLPSYNLEKANRVEVTIYGKILDRNYTKLLYTNHSLDISTVFLLDKVQKKEKISKADAMTLKRRKLLEGRYPSIFVSYEVADLVGQKTQYIRNKGLSDQACKQLILNLLKKSGKATRHELLELLVNVLPEILTQNQKMRKIDNLLQKMKNNDKTIVAIGSRRYSHWVLNNEE